MKAVSFYHKDTGLLHGNQLVVSDPAMIGPNTPPDHIAIEGHLDPLSHRIQFGTADVNGHAVQTIKVVDYQPPSPSADHEWNAATRRWQLSAAAQEKANRRTAARARIAYLECDQHRIVREHLLGGDPMALSKIRAIDAEIFALRADLK